MMTPHYFTLVHILLSLVGIATGFGALAGWLSDRLFPRWTALFLQTSIMTCLTGFDFLSRDFIFSLATGVGMLSIWSLTFAYDSLYIRKLRGGWRKVFLISSAFSLYLNVFVLIVQMFQKFPALVEMAPNPSGPALVGTHLIVLATFVVLGFAVVKRFRGDTAITE